MTRRPRPLPWPVAVLATLLATLCLLAGATVAAGPAGADPCPYVGECTPELGLAAGVVYVGQTQTFTASGFLPGETVVISVLGPGGVPLTISVVADANGTATGSFLVTADMLGHNTVTATGQTSGGVATQSFEVLEPPTSGPTTPGTGGSGGSGGFTGSSSGSLAFTGVAAGALGIVALLSLLLGVVLVVAGRRGGRARRDRHA